MPRMVITFEEFYMNIEQASELLTQLAVHPRVLKVFKAGATPTCWENVEQTGSVRVRLMLRRKEIEESVYIVWSPESPEDISVCGHPAKDFFLLGVIEKLKERIVATLTPSAASLLEQVG